MNGLTMRNDVRKGGKARKVVYGRNLKVEFERRAIENCLGDERMKERKEA